MRKTPLVILTLAVLLGAVSVGFAQAELKPVDIVSFAHYDRLKDDVALIGRLAGKPDLADKLETMLKSMTQGKGLAGLDTKRPWGVVYFTDGGPTAAIYGFVPVTDLKQLMEAAKSDPRLAAAIKLDNDVYVIEGSGMPLFVQQKGDWAIVTNARSNLANPPADPLKLLGNLPKDYDVAVRFLIKNIPDQLRQMGMSQLQAAAEGTMPPIPGGSERLKEAIPLITQLFNDLDEVTLGLKIDSSVNKCHLDLEMAAKSGTKLADKFAAMKAGKTAFAGMRLPDAALVISKTQTLTDDDVAKCQAGLAAFQKKFWDELGQKGLSESQVKLISRLSEDVLDVLQQTVAGKKIDGGFAVLLEPEAATVVAGATVVDGAKLEKSLERLADELQKTDPETAKTFRINARTYDGLHIHYLSVPTPDPRLVPFVGETTKIVLATASDKVLFAAGRNAAKTLKTVIDQSKADADREISSDEVRVSVGKFAKFIGDVAGDEAVKKPVDFLIGAIGKIGDKDHVSITTSPVASGVRVRVELEEGVLKALAAMGQAVMSLQTAPPADATTPPAATPK